VTVVALTDPNCGATVLQMWAAQVGTALVKLPDAKQVAVETPTRLKPALHENETVLPSEVVVTETAPLAGADVVQIRRQVGTAANEPLAVHATTAAALSTNPLLQEKITELGNDADMAETAPLAGANVVQTTGMQMGAAGKKVPPAVHVEVALPLSVYPGLQEYVTPLGNVVAVVVTAPLLGAAVLQTTGLQVGMPVVKAPDVWHVVVAVPTRLYPALQE
jgi:hypothetical protein